MADPIIVIKDFAKWLREAYLEPWVRESECPEHLDEKRHYKARLVESAKKYDLALLDLQKEENERIVNPSEYLAAYLSFIESVIFDAKVTYAPITDPILITNPEKAPGQAVDVYQLSGWFTRYSLHRFTLRSDFIYLPALKSELRKFYNDLRESLAGKEQTEDNVIQFLTEWVEKLDIPQEEEGETSAVIIETPGSPAIRAPEQIGGVGEVMDDPSCPTIDPFYLKCGAGILLVVIGTIVGNLQLSQGNSTLGIKPHYHPADIPQLDPGGQYPGQPEEYHTPPSHPRFHGMSNREAGTVIGLLMALTLIFSIKVISTAVGAGRNYFVNRRARPRNDEEMQELIPSNENHGNNGNNENNENNERDADAANALTL